MPDAAQAPENQGTPVKVTVQLDAKVYESFLQKARKAGLEIEPFLSSTLSIVLGCRVFNETHSCSPHLHVAQQPVDGPKRQD